MRKNVELHKKAQMRDARSNERNRMEFDERMRAREFKIRVGDSVLFAREQTSKAISKWDPDPFTVVFMNGRLVTEERIYP